ASERGKDGSIPAIFIESLKGNDCKVVNPWLESEVVVLVKDGKKNHVRHQIQNKNVIVHKTSLNQNYFMVKKGMEALAEPKVYKGIPNDSPKLFFEAMLGKTRNF
ncbi:MAG: hypothetical protein WCP85_09285, partial [Mariniphaga sp.]